MLQYFYQLFYLVKILDTLAKFFFCVLIFFIHYFYRFKLFLQNALVHIWYAYMICIPEQTGVAIV